MKLPPYIGLHGVKNAGKDTIFERLRELAGPSVVRFSVADPLKDSVSALFDISLDEIEVLKNDPDAKVKIVAKGEPARMSGGHMARYPSTMSFRRFLEKYGTESHRDQFGDDFWLNLWRVGAQRMHMDAGGTQPWLHLTGDHQITVVNTSVRFENEAEWIIENGGVIWQVIGTDEIEQAAKDRQREDGSDIPSETPLPYDLITATIDNSHRSTWEQTVATGIGTHETLDHGVDFSHVDDQLATLISNGGFE